MLSSLSPQRRRLVAAVGVLLGVLVAVALVAGGAGLVGSDRDGPRLSADPSRPGPVLLVPGYGGSARPLEALAARLRADGRTVDVVELPDGGTGDLRRAADRLAAAVDEVLRRTGAGSVDVVGYSAGGVVARLWVDQDGGGGRARRVVTLGSPHHGAEVAGYAATVAPEACPPACQQLAPGSELLAALNRGDETPGGPGWMSVWSQQDRTVTPPQSARLDGAVDVPLQAVCPDAQVSHGQLPSDPLPVGIVVRALSQAPLAEVRPTDCGTLRALGARS